MIIIHFWWLITSTTNWFYGIVSGWLGDVVLLGAIAKWYQLHKCKKCWRLSKHDVQGTHYKTCHHHLPDHDKIRAEHKLKFPLQHKILSKEK